MQTQEAIIRNTNIVQNIPSGSGVGNLVARLFGCWHKEMSRPFSNQDHTYRTCLDCGARRKFNLRSWEMQGDYYYRADRAA